MECIIITSTQSSDIYKYATSSQQSPKHTIPDDTSYGKCDNPILTEDPPRSLVLNVCGDIGSCGMADVSDPLLPFQYKTIDDGSVEEGANNSQDEVVTSTTLNESHKRPSVENTSSRKKTKVKKGSKVTLNESPKLKKLIEELSTSSSDEDNSESQPKTSEKFYRFV
jgi:hypothetical protein